MQFIAQCEAGILEVESGSPSYKDMKGKGQVVSPAKTVQNNPKERLLRSQAKAGFKVHF